MKIRRIISTIIPLVLCALVLLGSVTTAYGNTEADTDSHTKHSESTTFSDMLSNFVGSSFSIGAHTSPESDSPKIGTPFLIVLMWESPQSFSKIKSVLFVGTRVDVISYSGSYCLVETKSGMKGYVFYSWVMNKPEGTLSLNRTYETVYHNGTNLNQTTKQPRTQAIYNGFGRVKYSTDNADIISVDSKTGLITGKNPGKANLIAKVGDKEVSIPVCCVYKWDKPWTGKAKKSTAVYSGTSADAQKITTLSSGSKFIVRGDDGYSNGLAYGNISGTDTWGFVKINDISTKSTISYYNSLKWLWPIEDTGFNFIASSYGHRNVEVGNSEHKGIDISGNNILGEPLIAPFNGTVKKAEYNSSCGNYICITSKIPDYVTGENLIVIYMHMNSSALFDKGDEVSEGQVVGYIGSTGTSSGPHLHVEMNNKNAAVGETLRTTYAYTINPLYFYRDMGLRFYEDEAYKNHGAYWYSTEN